MAGIELVEERLACPPEEGEHYHSWKKISTASCDPGEGGENQRKSDCKKGGGERRVNVLIKPPMLAPEIPPATVLARIVSSGV